MIVPYVARTKASKERVREWVRARSASEALKEAILRYLVGSQMGQPDQTTLRDGSDNTQGRHCPRITQAYVSEDKKSRDD